MKNLFQKIKRITDKYEILYWLRFIIWGVMLTCTILFVINLFPNKKNSGVNSSLVPTENYVDKSGNTRSDIVVKEVVDKKEFKRVTDSLKKLLKGRVSISGVTTAASVVDTYFQDVPIYIDTTQDSFYLAKKDGYIDISVEGSIKTNKAVISYASIDTTTTIIYTKKRFLASDIRKVNISNKNPYNKIIAGNSVELKQQKSLLVVGPSVTYSPFNNKVSVGLSVTFNAFSIKTRK